MSVAHLHIRAAVDADNDERVGSRDEAVVAPKVDKSLCGTLTPVVLVVAGEYVERMSDAVECALDICELLVGTFVGEVAVDDDHVEVGSVDFVDGHAQGRVAGVARGHMYVAEYCDALCAGAEGERPGQYKMCES